VSIFFRPGPMVRKVLDPMGRRGEPDPKGAQGDLKHKKWMGDERKKGKAPKWAKDVPTLMPQRGPESFVRDDASVASDDINDEVFLSDMLESRTVKRKRAPKSKEVFKEAYPEGRHNISSADATAQSLSVERLLGALQDAKGADMARARKRLRKMTLAAGQTLGLEKTKLQKDKEEREAVRGEFLRGMKEWQPVVQELEEMPIVNFPLHVAPRSVGLTMETLTQTKDGETPLEQKVRETLEKAGIRTRVQKNEKDEVTDIVALDADDRDLLGPEASRVRHDQRAKLKAVLRYKHQKSTWIKHIKSKTFRKIARRSRLTREEKALVKLEEVNPQAAITKRREQMERDRAMERATLKHRNTATNIRRRRNLLKWSKVSREDMHSAHAIAEKLREKFEEVMDAKLEEESEESEDGDDEKDKELAQKDQVTAEGATESVKASKATSIIETLRRGVVDDCPIKATKGIASLPFMKRAYQRQREELLKEIKDLETGLQDVATGKLSPVEFQSKLMKEEQLRKSLATYEEKDNGSDHDEFGFLTQRAIRRRDKQRQTASDQEIRRVMAPKDDEADISRPAKSKMPKAPVKASQAKPTSGLGRATPTGKGPALALPQPVQAPLPPKAPHPHKAATEFLDAIEAELEDAEAVGEARRQGRSVTPKDAAPSAADQADPADGTDARPSRRARKRTIKTEDSGTAATALTTQTKGTQRIGGADEGYLSPVELDMDEDDPDDVEGPLLHPTLLDDPEFIARQAFADDNVDEDFMREKEELLGIDAAPVDENKVLPGWGEWGGKAAELNVRRDAVLQAMREEREKRIEELRTQRADCNLANVIINENVSNVPVDYSLKHLPWMFTDEGQYHNSMRQPLSKECNTALSAKAQIQPAFRTRRGQIIQPLTKDALPNQKPKPTQLRKRDIAARKAPTAPPSRRR